MKKIKFTYVWFQSAKYKRILKNKIETLLVLSDKGLKSVRMKQSVTILCSVMLEVLKYKQEEINAEKGISQAVVLHFEWSIHEMEQIYLIGILNKNITRIK